MTGRIIALVTEVMGHLGLQRTLEHGLGHLVEQPIDAVDRCAGGLRVGEQSVDRRRLEGLGEPTGRRGLGIEIDLVLCHVGVLPDRHVDHSGRSWSTRCLVGWATGAVPGLLPARFPWPPAEPDVRFSPHPALHVSRSLSHPVTGWVLVHGVGIRVPR